jgi:hypothetical protein
MAISSFRPSSGGGMPGMNYIASIFMETYARNWNQAGTAGYYSMSSANNSTGYVYFVGATTTGGPLGQTLYISHAFTSIQVVASKNDLISLYKASTKTTTDLANPGSKYVDWLYNSKYTSYTVKSGVTQTWTLPAVGVPLLDLMIVGGGGYADHHGAGGGGGGVVYLTYFPTQSNGTLSWTIGNGGTGTSGRAGDTVLNSTITAFGGGNSQHNQAGNSGGCGAGAAVHANTGAKNGGASIQTTPSVTSPAAAAGYGSRGGNVGNSAQHYGAGGGGASGSHFDASSSNPTNGGAGHLCQIDYQYYGAGGGGSNHDTKVEASGGIGTGNWGAGGNSGWNSARPGVQGGVVLRYYA